jgi:UTP--glucose-1-phosphate uridylyltransferase
MSRRLENRVAHTQSALKIRTGYNPVYFELMSKDPSNRIRKGVILAGGLGTRLLPLTRAIPKEMLPLGAKPILHHIVDELRGAGIEQVIIVSRKGKGAIADYFEREPGVRVIEKNEAKGPGHSVLIAWEHIGEENFLVAFGDSPYAGAAPRKFIRKMLDVHASQRADVVVAVHKVPRGETHLRGMIRTSDPLDALKPALVNALVQKPKPSESPGHWGVAGRYIFAPVIFDALHTVASRAKGEILLADAINHMLGAGARVVALPVSEGLRRLDTGGLEGYFKAFQVFAKEYHRNQ